MFFKTVDYVVHSVLMSLRHFNEVTDTNEHACETANLKQRQKRNILRMPV